MEFGGETKQLVVLACIAKDVDERTLEHARRVMGFSLEKAGVANGSILYTTERAHPHDEIVHWHTHILASGDALTTDAPSRDARELEIEQMYGSMYDLRQFAK